MSVSNRLSVISTHSCTLQSAFHWNTAGTRLPCDAQQQTEGEAAWTDRERYKMGLSDERQRRIDGRMGIKFLVARGQLIT